MTPPYGRDWGGNDLGSGILEENSLQSKKNIKACLMFDRKHLDDSQDFWGNTLWTDKTKVEHFGRCVSRYVWSKRPQAEVNLGSAAGQ